MAEQSVIGVYDSMAGAEAAVRKLNDGGYPINQISIVARDLQHEEKIQGYLTTGDVARTGALTGAWAGGIFGLLVGAAFLWVPVLGPFFIAGPLAAMLLNGLEGAALGALTGGALGGLIGWGVSKDHILKYEDYVRGGKYLLVAHGNAEEVQRAYTLLQGTGAQELQMHTGSGDQADETMQTNRTPAAVG